MENCEEGARFCHLDISVKFSEYIFLIDIKVFYITRQGIISRFLFNAFVLSCPGL